MWLDDLKPGQSWIGIWSQLIQCADCGALIGPSLVCPVCGKNYAKAVDPDQSNEGQLSTGTVFPGAFSWSHWVLLRLMQREWGRPLSPEDRLDGLPPSKTPSQRFVIVLLFWSLFEHLMERFYTSAVRGLPMAVGADVLARYGAIGSRLDRLHRILFGSTFQQDLVKLGYAQLADVLTRIQVRRNSFIHDDPQAIDDDLVTSTIENLQLMQEAWVALFNFRCAKPGLPPLRLPN